MENRMPVWNRMVVIARCAALAALPIVFATCSNDDNPVQPAAYEFASMEQRVLTLINQERASNASPLPALSSRDIIVQEARKHSQEMASGSVAFGHDGFSMRLENIGKVISWQAGSENVAYNGGYSDPPAKAVTDWMNSSSHRANILGDYDLTGIGIARNTQGIYYFTQIFIKSR